MEIKPTYITFEQAKLLKEKWFNENVEGLYFDTEIKVLPIKPSNIDFASTRYYSAPEQHIVVEWLRIKHGIFIGIDVVSNLFKYKILKCEGLISQTFGNEIKCSSFDFNSPQEAYIHAFDYILKEMI